MAGSTVLLLDEPTRGVDVGAKVEIYELINEITENGGAVVMVSSELPEVLGMSDRILVMSNGQVAGTLDADDATEDAVMSLAVSAVSSAVASTGGRLRHAHHRGVLTGSAARLDRPHLRKEPRP